MGACSRGPAGLEKGRRPPSVCSPESCCGQLSEDFQDLLLGHFPTCWAGTHWLPTQTSQSLRDGVAHSPTSRGHRTETAGRGGGGRSARVILVGAHAWHDPELKYLIFLLPPLKPSVYLPQGKSGLGANTSRRALDACSCVSNYGRASVSEHPVGPHAASCRRLLVSLHLKAFLDIQTLAFKAPCGFGYLSG